MRAGMIWRKALMATPEALQKAAHSGNGAGGRVSKGWTLGVRMQWTGEHRLDWKKLKGLFMKGLNCPSFGPQNKNFKGFNQCNNQG